MTASTTAYRCKQHETTSNLQDSWANECSQQVSLFAPRSPHNHSQRSALSSHPLQNSSNRQSRRSRLITTLEVARSRTQHNSHQQPRNTFIVDIQQSRLRPLEIQDCCRVSKRLQPQNSEKAIAKPSIRRKIDVPIIRKNPLPSYQPALTAPRSLTGRAFIDACLNWSRPLLCTIGQ